jgi:hypothetical protein
MTEVILTFQYYDRTNISVQVGDTAYYVNGATTVGGFSTAEQTSITTIGEVTSVEIGGLVSGGVQTETLVIKCNMNNDVTPPTTASYVMFSKDNTVNMSSLLGYYGAAKFKNDSRDKAEMFSTACEIHKSSK